MDINIEMAFSMLGSAATLLTPPKILPNHVWEEIWEDFWEE